MKDGTDDRHPSDIEVSDAAQNMIDDSRVAVRMLHHLSGRSQDELERQAKVFSNAAEGYARLAEMREEADILLAHLDATLEAFAGVHHEWELRRRERVTRLGAIESSQ